MNTQWNEDERRQPANGWLRDMIAEREQTIVELRAIVKAKDNEIASLNSQLNHPARFRVEL